MKKIHFICFLLFSLLPMIGLSAVTPNSVIELNTGFKDISPTQQLRYIEDPSGRLSLEDILNVPTSSWHPPPNNSVHFGYSQSAFWLKLSIQNISQNSQSLYLHVDYALLDKIEFFQVQKNKVLSQILTGDHLPFHDRPVDFPTFLIPFSLETNAVSDVYLRIESSGTVHSPLSIWEKEQFLLNSQSYLFFYGCFLSAMLIMSAYNFFLFLTLREKSYLLYSMFILIVTGGHSSLDGFSYQWFWPNSPAWQQISAVFFITTGCFVTTLFTQTLLPIPKNGFIRIGITFLVVFTACSALMCLLLSYRHAAMLSGFTTMISMLGIIIICLAMIKRSPVIARYFILAWGIYFVGILLKSASSIGLMNTSFLSEYSGNMGAVAGILIMSLAMAERINIEKRGKQQAKKESIKHLQRFESLYKNAFEGIFIFNTKGQLISANPAFLKLMGVADVVSFNSRENRSHRYQFSQSRFDRILNILRKKGSIAEHETKVTNHLDEIIWVNLSARLIKDSDNGDERIEGTLININARKTIEEKLKHLADHDSLTGLVNRRAFELATKRSLEEVKNQQKKSCVLYLDLDQFKIVNDLCGHAAGDLLLKNLSLHLQKYIEKLNKEYIIARLGGDEFGVLLSETSLSKAQAMAEQFRQIIDDFLFVWEGNRFSLGVSIGLVELLPFHHSMEQVLVMADTACYLAKDEGRNRVHIFIESDQELEFRQLEMQWVSNIKEALSEDNFFLVFQNIASNQKDVNGYHYEILLRLVSKQGNLCTPGQFLPASERYNLMPSIDRWVINHYFSWLNKHPEHLGELACASINLSTTSIGDNLFFSFLTEAFEKYSIPYDKICFEIIESMAITHIDKTNTFIEKFHDLGCRFALDDFGTGFSSYAYLKQLPVDYLKIDGMFIKNLSDDAVNLAMVKSISEVAKAIGIETIAEFVETEEVRMKLAELGITYSQGYHLHKPVKLDISRFDSLLNQQI